MQKVQFNYEVWKNHPERDKITFETRGGVNVTNFTDHFYSKTRTEKQVMGILELDKKSVEYWDEVGNYSPTKIETTLDLFMILPDEPGLYTVLYINEFQRALLGPIAGSPEDAFAALEKAEIMATRIYGTYKLVKQ